VARREDHAPEELYAVAKRVAALTIFGKKAAICDRAQTDECSQGAIEIGDLAGGREGAFGASFAVTPAIIRELLRTSLFSGRTSGHMGWAHQTYAEYMAARWMLEKGLTTEQIADILFSPPLLPGERGRLVPQLQETAAWVATMKPQIMEDIIQTDPQALLRSSVACADNTSRGALVESLLKKAQGREIADFDLELRQRYDVLGHPGLADQVRPYIGDGTKDYVARRMAIDIAEACECQEVVEDLLAVALSNAESHHIRVQAVHAIVAYGGVDVTLRLRPLLAAGAEDIDDDFKGYLLRALWPDHMLSEELFQLLTPPRKEHYSGAYQMFATYELPNRLDKIDLPVALKWVAQLPPDHYFPHMFLDAASAILGMAWGHLGDDETLEAFALTAIARLERHDGLFPAMDKREQNQPVELDDATRHRLVRAIVTQSPGVKVEAHHLYFCVPSLLGNEDTEWLIAELDRCDVPSQREIWAELAYRMFDRESVSQIEAVFDATERSVELANQAGYLFRVMALDSEEGRKWKRYHDEAVDRKRRRGPAPVKHPPLAEMMESRLQKFEAGDVDAWWGLNLEMTLPPDSDYFPIGAEINPDLTTLPGWEAMDAAQKARCIQAAKDYLVKGEPNTVEWLGTNKLERPALAGYRAIRLLQKKEPGSLAGIRDEIWARWGPAILAYPESAGMGDDQPLLEAVAMAYHHAPDEMLTTLMALIDKENAEHGMVFILRKFEKAWDERLVTAVIEKIRLDGSLKAGAVWEMLNEVLQHNEEEVVQPVIDLLPGSIPESGEGRDRLVATGGILLMRGGGLGFHTIWKHAQVDAAYGREVVTRAAGMHEAEVAANVASTVDERQVADFYVWLAQQFPYSEDPKHEGVHAVGPRESVAELRDMVLDRLQAKGTIAAYSAVLYIAETLKLDWLRYTIIRARNAVLRTAWEGHPASELLAMAEDHSRRFVESPRQLLEVLCASLIRLQTKLHRELPAVYDLWNDVSAGSGRRSRTPKDEIAVSDYVCRYLQDDLTGRGIVANREVRIRRGEQTDIHVVALRRGEDADQCCAARVIIEVKGCWHLELRTAMEDQLKERYLKDNQDAYGLYLVAWFPCDEWDDSDRRKTTTPRWTTDEADEFFQGQAARLSTAGCVVGAVLLDASWR